MPTRSRHAPDRAGQPADAIVVLGCRPATGRARRLDRGIGLLREGAAPLLVLSGGGAGPATEAELMRRAALAAGVPEAALIIEPVSRNTLGNARESARLLQSRGLRSIVLVSDRAHLLRASLLFRLAGLRVVAVAWPCPPAMPRRVGAAIYEIAALPKSIALALFRRHR